MGEEEQENSKFLMNSKFFERFEVLNALMKNPEIRDVTMDIIRKQEMEEKEQKVLRDEDVVLRLEDVEKLVIKLWKEIRLIKESQFTDHEMLRKLTDKVDETICQSLERSGINLLELQESFYQVLRNNFSMIDEVNLCYVQEKPDIVYITVVYDDSAENYTEVEMKIFDVFEESTKEFPSMNAEILVLVNMDNFECPQDANVILKR